MKRVLTNARRQKQKTFMTKFDLVRFSHFLHFCPGLDYRSWLAVFGRPSDPWPIKMTSNMYCDRLGFRTVFHWCKPSTVSNTLQVRPTRRERWTLWITRRSGAELEGMPRKLPSLWRTADRRIHLQSRLRSPEHTQPISKSAQSASLNK